MSATALNVQAQGLVSYEAGSLRERIENDERVDVFTSADVGTPARWSTRKGSDRLDDRLPSVAYPLG
jgi:hypothetical protein